MRSARNTARDLGTHQAMVGQKDFQNQPFFGMLGQSSRHGYVSAHAVAVDGYIHLPKYLFSWRRPTERLPHSTHLCTPAESSASTRDFMQYVRRNLLSPLYWCSTMYSLT
jgi:hypothetical protein